MFNSRHYDMTSVERYVGQSTIAIIYDITYALRRMNECHSWVYEPSRSKIGSSKEIVGECKYLILWLTLKKFLWINKVPVSIQGNLARPSSSFGCATDWYSGDGGFDPPVW